MPKKKKKKKARKKQVSTTTKQVTNKTRTLTIREHLDPKPEPRHYQSISWFIEGKLKEVQILTQ